MKKIEIDKKNFLEICNINHGVYHPLKNFMNKEDIMSVSSEMKMKNGIFFPLPIYLIINNKFEKKCAEKNTIKIYYKNQRVCDFLIEKIFKLTLNEKRQLGKLIYKTTSKKHPGYLFFLNENGTYLSGKITNFNKNSIKKINFSMPTKIRDKLKHFKKVAGFHTRNIPHRGHEWIHSLGKKKCNNILIQPIVGHFKSGEYSEEAIIKANKTLVVKKNKLFKNKKLLPKYYFSFINLQPKYAGPREALFHALIRKNYGCTHFLVGRDHAGYKNFYRKYDSQKLCKKYEKKLNIKIIKFISPKICLVCKSITNDKCKCDSRLKKLIDINGSEIRNLIKEKKEIPNYLIEKKLFKNINIKKLLH